MHLQLGHYDHDALRDGVGTLRPTSHRNHTIHPRIVNRAHGVGGDQGPLPSR